MLSRCRCVMFDDLPSVCCMQARIPIAHFRSTDWHKPWLRARARTLETDADMYVQGLPGSRLDHVT